MQPAHSPQPIIHKTVAQVTGRLLELGLTQEQLRAVAVYAYSYYADCTPHDARSAPGYNLWNKGVRGLRDLLVLDGWTKGSDDGYETVVHPTGQWQIAVAGGDERTGLDGPNPATRTSKGRATRRAVKANLQSQAQGTFWGLRPNLTPPSRTTWILLLHVDEMEELVRAELSLPTGFDDLNHVSWWDERILLPTISYDEMHVEFPSSDDGDDEIDFEVHKRAG